MCPEPFLILLQAGALCGREGHIEEFDFIPTKLDINYYKFPLQKFPFVINYRYKSGRKIRGRYESHPWGLGWGMGSNFR